MRPKIETPLCKHPIARDQFVCPSVRLLSFHPSVHLRLLVRNISSLPLAQSGQYFTHRIPLGKGYAVMLNHVSKFKVRVLSELYLKSMS